MVLQEEIMDDPNEVNRKLRKETHNLNLLKEALQKSSQLTGGMTSILTSFENRLAKLEQTILPVYNETENLQLRQENIEKTIATLEHVISYYSVSKEVEHVIKDGPTNGLDSYLESIDKIQNSVKYFEKNNPNSSEMHNLTTLYDTAGDALEKEFRSLLTRNSKPVPPIILLDLALYDEELPSEEEKIVEHLSGLKDHQKSSSGGSMTLPVHSSPALGRVRTKDTPSRKTGRKIQQALITKASRLSQSVEQAAGFALGHRRQGSHLEPKDEILDIELDFYQTCVTALHRLMQSEWQLMNGIIPLDHRTQIFERVIVPGLDMVVQEGESIATRTKKCVGKHDFLGALSVFPILKHLVGMKPEFDSLLEKCNPNIRLKFSGVISTLHSVGAKALEDFIDSIKTDPDRQMPKDGTVHELTSNVMMILEQLLDYLDIIGSILSEDISCQSNLLQFQESQKKRAAIGIYITRVLTILNLTLNNKSETYNDVYLKSIFRLNNHHYILKSLQRNGFIEIVQLYNKDLEDHYNGIIMEQKRLYSQSWSRVLHYIMEVDKPLPAVVPGVKLKDKDRQNIKDKFTGFNREIDDISKAQKGYAIPDVELRESLKRDNKDFILPKYQSFYQKYIQMQFTKNVDKYVRYNPVEVSNLLDKFFDVAA